ncbi:type I-E CRISPR-associated protein Cas6/Cse3/CasE [Leucobacter insecticola]|uniref:Type I-E CRISPR-associated protein Cas6/Cse3/CasE n=1 Tax=Leucobacter insecticola TaxID=2714934 RepID=A0A6G8FHA8_9MICO|nr:type I-E CRISPR-associated protein Cas6/Cse3/CasE [Leucobacter insecticola]QIM15751.1 type I-E CRISPR-associated protein Cas6/Cse3/CasE [Leucobacter insecticola]
MFLTRMFLNPRRRQAMRFQQDPQAMHAAVESSFPPDPGGTNPRTLWRLESEGSTLRLFLLSERVPSLEHLQEQAGWMNEVTWESRPYDSLLARLQLGQQYGFRVTANPVHTVTGKNGQKRKLAHVTVAQQAKWLADRADLLGVRFLRGDGEALEGEATEAILVSNRETLRFHRGEQRVTLARAQFDGLLEVSDVSKLQTALVAGIGRGKAYGCGLLTLAPHSPG